MRRSDNHMYDVTRGGRKRIGLAFFLAVLLVSLPARGDTVDANDGLQILKQAESTLARTPFYAKCNWSSGLQTIVLQKNGGQGRYLFKKQIVTESMGYVATNEFLMTDVGQWRVLPHIALRTDFVHINNESAFCGLLENGLDTSVEAQYDVEQKQVEGRVMLSVSQTPKLEYHHIVHLTILIGRDDHLIYGYTSKTSDGAISTMTVTEFRAEPNLSDDEFMLPTGIEEVICTNSLQYSKLMIGVDKAIVNSPSFKVAALRYQHKFRGIRYTIFGVMIASTACLIGYYHATRRKSKQAGT